MRGHVRQRGDAWELRAYMGKDPVTGREKYKTQTVRCGKRAAEAELARFVTQVADGGHSAGDTTLSELIQRWLELVQDDLSPSTVRGYERIIRCYNVGKLHLDKLRTDQLDRFYANLRESVGVGGSPLSPATIRQTHAVIRRALNQAHRWGWIASNPAALASPPTVRTRSVSPPDPSQVLRLIDEAAQLDPDMACFLLLAATTGARRGALCALRWTDIDLDLCTAVIARSLVEGQGSKLVERTPKRTRLDEWHSTGHRSPNSSATTSSVGSEQLRADRLSVNRRTSSLSIRTAIDHGYRMRSRNGSFGFGNP